MIKRQKNNGKLSYVVDLRDKGHKRKYFKTKADAQDYMDLQVKQLQGVRESRNKKTDWTFDTLIKSYIDELQYKGKNVHNKIRTMYMFQDLVIDGCKVSKMKVRDFVIGDINTIYKKIRVSRSQKTISEYMAHVRQLLNYAVLESIVSINVFSQLPEGSKLWNTDEPKKLSPAITEDIIHKIADQLDGQYKIMYLFSAYTGLRSGELRALHWSDLDFEKGEVNVNKAVAYGREYVFVDGKRYERGSMIVKETKTAAGVRRVPMIDFIINMMREFKLASNNGPRVFNSRGDNIVADSRFPEILRTACSQANVERIRWHDLRHYFASQLLKIYSDDWNRIKTYMGHTNIQTTINIYGHWIETDAEKKINRSLLNDKLGKVAAQ